MPGKNTSKAEILDITRHGVRLFAGEREFFLPFESYPWFKDASVSAVYNVKLVHPSHLHWPDLDVDLDLESLAHPERYPLLFQAKVRKGLQLADVGRTASEKKARRKMKRF